MVEVKKCESPRNAEEDVGGMTNLAGIADEDFKAAGESSAPTEESAPEDPNNKSFDSDAILDDPACDRIICHADRAFGAGQFFKVWRQVGQEKDHECQNKCRENHDADAPDQKL